MEKIVEEKENMPQALVPFWKLGVFLGYSFVGLAGIGFFTYKTFINRHENVYDKHNKKFIKGSPLFKNIAKTISWTGFFFITAGFLIHTIKPTQLVVRQALKVDRQYQNNIKVDPVFQNYYIFQTMNYFGVSQKLIKKTQEELKQIKKSIKQPELKLPQQQMELQRELVRMVLARQNFNKIQSQIEQKKAKTSKDFQQNETKTK